jgi:16S rRNA (cytosine967-C5)-methyltransferase
VNGQNPREIAADVLQRRTEGAYIETLLDAALEHSSLSAADRGLCQELTYGVVRWQSTLDWLIARKTQHKPQKPLLQDLLRLGLYQIFWLDRIPNHAAVNETVEVAKRKGLVSQSGFINAVLRGFLRELDATRKLLAELKIDEPWFGYSHPEWLVKRWEQRFGTESTASLMAWNNTPPKTFARVNTLQAEPGKLLEQWRNENVEYDFVRHDWVEENLVFELKSHPPLKRLASFQQGLFYVQDPSTLLAVRELAPQPSEIILDLCSAPGGKLSYLAQLIKNEGTLIAHDVDSERLGLIKENCQRLGVTCVQTALPSTLNQQSSAKYDRILVDAPCSNTGVMRRRVDLRWRIRPEEITRLRESQLSLLGRAANLLKPRGTLIYSTCSLEPEENDQVVKEFLAKNPPFRLEAQRELLPLKEGVDGAFVARLIQTN